MQRNYGSTPVRAELSPPAERREYPFWPEQTLNDHLFPPVRLPESLCRTAPQHRILGSLDLWWGKNKGLSINLAIDPTRVWGVAAHETLLSISHWIRPYFAIKYRTIYIEPSIYTNVINYVRVKVSPPPCGLCRDSLRCMFVSVVLRLSSRCLLFHSGRLLLISGLPGLFSELLWVMGNSPSWSITLQIPTGASDRQSEPRKYTSRTKVVTDIQMVNDLILYGILLDILDRRNYLYCKDRIFHVGNMLNVFNK